MVNQLLGAKQPMGAIEPHRFGIDVVAERHREDREGLKTAKAPYSSPGLGEPPQQSRRVVNQGRIVAEPK